MLCPTVLDNMDLRIRRFCCGTQEVVGEIRDKKSREWLQTLPYKLDIIEPCEESIKAGAATKAAAFTGRMWLTALPARKRTVGPSLQMPQSPTTRESHFMRSHTIRKADWRPPEPVEAGHQHDCPRSRPRGQDVWRFPSQQGAEKGTLAKPSS